MPPPQYRYKALGPGAATRILMLLPGLEPEPIRILLENAVLDESTPQYEALSYAWGSHADPGPIQVGHQGYRPSGTLLVTQNLLVALRHLRRKDTPRVLWIDAICIDQGNIEERGRQVKNMGMIYSMAFRVVVWLGEESFNSALALNMLEKWCQGVRVNWRKYEMEPARRTRATVERTNQTREMVPGDEVSRAIYDLLGRSWFERLWVWQEVALAPQASCFILCGKNTMSWEDFTKAIFVVQYKGMNFAPGDPQVYAQYLERRQRVFRLCHNSRSGDSKSFTALARATRVSKCTDPRDRIYALLSMISSGKSLDIEADYSKTAAETYEELLLCDLKKTCKGRLFSYCNFYEGKSMPSWVPDWGHQSPSDPIPPQHASVATHVSYESLGAGVLQLTGAHIDEVKQVHQHGIIDRATPPKQAFKELQQMLAFFNKHTQPGSKESGFEKFCRFVHQDYFAHRFRPRRRGYPEFEDFRDALESFLDNPYDADARKKMDELYRLGTAVGMFFPGKMPYVTSKGHFGLAPLSIQPGDQVVVFLGCLVASVLRPSKDGRFQLLGEAYCMDFMTGEALLGPLPEGVQLCSHIPEGGNNRYWRYFNLETGEMLLDDPRLEHVPVPVGWRRDEAYKVVLIDNETSPSWDIGNFDPRLTCGELRKRGVAIRDFVLV